MNEGTSNDSPKESAEKIIEPIRIPTAEEVKAQDVWNNCAIRSVASGVMGGVMGIAMGLLAGAVHNPIKDSTMTRMQQIKFAARQMGAMSRGSCKAFAFMGFVFSAAECVVEKARAKHDIANTVAAGCVTGATTAARGGPQAACIGCAGFAAFSVALEKFFERHECRNIRNFAQIGFLEDKSFVSTYNIA